MRARAELVAQRRGPLPLAAPDDVYAVTPPGQEGKTKRLPGVEAAFRERN